MSGAGHRMSGSDILSQALLQTGVSNSIKLEAEGVRFDLPSDHLLSCDVQTLTNDLISKLDDKEGLPGITLHPGPLEGHFESTLIGMGPQHLGVPSVAMLVDGATTTDAFKPVTVPMPRLRKMENGLVPPQIAPVPDPQPTTCAIDNHASGFGGDIDLEELLSINVEQPDAEMYPPPPPANSVNYPLVASVNPQTFSSPYNSSYQSSVSQTPASVELPELMNEDLYDIFGDQLVENNFPASNVSYTQAENRSVLSGEQATYGRPISYAPTPPMSNPLSGVRSYSPSSHLSATPLSSSLPGYNAAQHLQHVANNRQQLLQQQMYQKLQGNRTTPTPRPLPVGAVVGGVAKLAPGASDTTEPPQDAVGDSDDDDDEDFSGANTYSNYVPSKVKFGRHHPDPVVESSSLSSVDPPEVTFTLKLPMEGIDSGKLSSLQLESVIYACQQHLSILADGSRAGFLVGDGAGVGKGRIIAGIIQQNYIEGRKKAIWLSVSNDLRLDAARDFKDVGAKKIEIYSLNKFHYGKISGKRNGRVRKGVIFATYSSLIGESTVGGKYKTRFDQLVHWLGSQFEGVIVFDECHKAKNLVPTGASKPSKTGLTVLQLQKKLPKARIVYCSATGASEPKNMAYMSRLGIWGKGTQFNSFLDFIKAVERRGVGAMEIVAIDMKLRGMYMARQLSFCGVTFSINEVELTDSFVEGYDASVKLWVETRRLFQEASDLMDYDKQKLKTMWGQFWASHQRFFKYMCIAAKVQETIRLTKKALADGKCVVIGLQSTGEARTLEQLERSDGELAGFISTTKGVLETLIRRHFPAPATAPGLSGIDWSLMDNDPTLPRSCRRRRQRKKPVGLRDREGTFSDSDNESSDSPERSDSAVESSSDEGERSSEGSGSSSSESKDDDDDDDDNDVNPFGSDFSDPWLQKKKVKAKSRKRAWSPSSSSNPSQPQNKKRNFSIKPPPHSSKKGKTKTGFNSKNLKFEEVSSPDAHSSKSSPLSFPLSTRLQAPPIDRSHASSVTEDSSRGFYGAQGALRGGGGGGRSHVEVDQAGSRGQNILDAMNSKFISNVPAGLPMGKEADIFQSATVKKMKEELLHKLELLSPHLPNNTLDELIDGLGGTRSVAEMTGRRGRVVSTPGGGAQYQLRTEPDVPTELLNIRERQRFMDGDKHVAIISEAASSGISLQADRRVKNHRRRVHMTLELPWSADRAIQQFGRTHRSNQVSAPEYIFLISTLSGEQRFASIVAKRLQSLGALTHGDRRATETRDLSKYNVDTKYGRQALEKTVRSIVGTERPNIKMDDYPKDFFEKCRSSMVGVGLLKSMGLSISIDKDATTMSRFLNRLLGLPVKLQNQLFSYFSDTLAAVVQKEKRAGHWDGGILDFGSSGEHVEIISTETYPNSGDPSFNVASSELYTVEVERGLSFDEAHSKLTEDMCPEEGFYTSKRVCNDKQTAVLVKMGDSSGKYFLLYRPNTGRNGKMEKMSGILKKYDKVDVAEGKKWWTAQYESSLETCTHAFWQGRCRRLGCNVGLRRKTYYMLGGSVLGVWTHIEAVFNLCSGRNQRMQIIRVKTQQKRLVGILVPKSCVEEMRKSLKRVAGTEGNPITL